MRNTIARLFALKYSSLVSPNQSLKDCFKDWHFEIINKTITTTAMKSFIAKSFKANISRKDS